MSPYREDMLNYINKDRKTRTPFFYLTLRKKQNRKGLLRKFWSFLFRVAQLGSGCEIATTKIGRRVFFPHINGIIIAYHAKIGDDCVICQQVTIGIDRFKDTSKAPIIEKQCIHWSWSKNNWSYLCRR